MQLMETAWSKLPSEILEHVLIFLPVPALCKFCTVCKRWKQFFDTSGFLNLRDQYARQELYLLVVRHLHWPDWSMFEEGAGSFVDLNGRWYTRYYNRYFLLRHFGTDNGECNVTLMVGMDSGLICELFVDVLSPVTCYLTITDPVAWVSQTIWVPLNGHRGDELPMIDMVVNDIARYKVFLLDNTVSDLDSTVQTRMHACESSVRQRISELGVPCHSSSFNGSCTHFSVIQKAANFSLKRARCGRKLA